MNFKFVEKPSKHIIIDNFFSTQLANECLEEFIKLEPYYQDAQTSGMATFEDNCEICSKENDFQVKFIRDNSMLSLNDLYKKTPYNSIIMKSIHEQLKIGSPLDSFCKNISGFFSLISQVNSSETQLSRYGKCEFYGIHKDNSIEIPQTRILTLVYYVNKEPAKFEGGDLIIYNEKLDENLRIKPKHNRAILFESKTKHAVDTVKLNGDFADGRFSVNCWLGFENLLRFR